MHTLSTWTVKDSPRVGGVFLSDKLKSQHEISEN